jgi:hypothetical protein
MNNDLLTLVEKPGSYVLDASATLAERSAFALHLMALKSQGHAVMADEVVDDGKQTGAIRVFHYLSCVKCRKQAI